MLPIYSDAVTQMAQARTVSKFEVKTVNCCVEPKEMMLDFPVNEGKLVQKNKSNLK